jgi:hypothetical protein
MSVDQTLWHVNTTPLEYANREAAIVMSLGATTIESPLREPEEGLTKGVYLARVTDEFLGASISCGCELSPPVSIVIPLAT